MISSTVTRVNALALLLGGIALFANLVLCFAGGLSMLGAVRGPDASPRLWVLAGPSHVLAVVYGALLLRGPFDPLRGE